MSEGKGGEMRGKAGHALSSGEEWTTLDKEEREGEMRPGTGGTKATGQRADKDAPR